MTPESLAHQIDEYCEKTGKSRTAFGYDVVGDPNLVFQLHKGRNIGLRLVGKILQVVEEPDARGVQIEPWEGSTVTPLEPLLELKKKGGSQ